jgi:hypothetical protein
MEPSPLPISIATQLASTGAVIRDTEDLGQLVARLRADARNLLFAAARDSNPDFARDLAIRAAMLSRLSDDIDKLRPAPSS